MDDNVNDNVDDNTDDNADDNADENNSSKIEVIQTYQTNTLRNPLGRRIEIILFLVKITII